MNKDNLENPVGCFKYGDNLFIFFMCLFGVVALGVWRVVFAFSGGKINVMNVLPTCVCLCTTCLVPHGPEKGSRFLGIGVTDSCGLPCDVRT